MTLLTKNEILDIYQGIQKGPYTLMEAHDSLDVIMEKILGVQDFTQEKFTLSSSQIQILDKVIRLLHRKCMTKK